MGEITIRQPQVRDYVAAFLDATLGGKKLDPPLVRLPSEYPDAIVTAQRESLCDETPKH